MVWSPAVSAELAVMLQTLPLTTALPMVPSTLEMRVTVSPVVPVPVKVGVVSLVRLSVFEVPVSLLAARSGVLGADGAVLSIVTLRALELLLTLFAESVALAVIACVTPAVNVSVVICQLPSVAVAEPIEVAPPPTWSLYKVTVEPLSAVPLKVGVVSLVMLSVFDEPVSEAASRSGVDGASGATLSTTVIVNDSWKVVVPSSLCTQML